MEEYPGMTIGGMRYNLTQEEKDHLDKGKLVLAVKGVQYRTELGLRSSKSLVDDYLTWLRRYY